MLLDQHHIQTRGCHNTADENGNVTGFQFRLRTKYYKGVWLSQMRIGDVIVDGEHFSREQQIWVINGTEYTPDEMLEVGDQLESTYWQVKDAAVVKIKKQGGLSQGYHAISVEYGWICNYAPAITVDPVLGTTIMTRNNERTILIV